MSDTGTVGPPLSDRFRTSELILACARASCVAYEPAKGTPVFASYSHRAILAEHEGIPILAFRGTANFSDVKTDAQLWWAKGPWGHVHRGFLHATDSVLGKIPDSVLDDECLWITGHSLGGAMAMIAAARLCSDKRNIPAGICTFGQPPVGSLWFSSQFKCHMGSRYYRFVNSIDMVPDAPVLAHHVGKAFYIDARGMLSRGASPFRKLIDAGVEGWNQGPVPQLECHRMKGYYQALEKQKARFCELLG